METSFSKGMLQLLQKLNCVNVHAALDRGCQPFYVNNKQVGLIRSDFWIYLKTFTDVFVQVQEGTTGSHQKLKCGVHLNPNLQSYQEKSDAVNNVLELVRSKDVVPALRGWRDEAVGPRHLLNSLGNILRSYYYQSYKISYCQNYSVCQKYSEAPLLEVERAGAGLFGFIQYGVQVNGYTVDGNGGISLWIGRRSKTKQTFPNMFDSMIAGGLPAGMGILDCVKKECEEEAGLSGKLLDKLQFTGTVSYFYEDVNGMFPECHFVYDLHLPEDFIPQNCDGEVESFQKYSVNELKDLMIGDNISPSCGAICLDFLIRNGLINPDTDPLCSYYVEQMHASIQSCYAGSGI